MSLVSSEGEGEQNEIRILQDKLSATMKLVSHLTAQLSELKEQVRPTSWPLLAAPAVPEAPACLPGGGEGGGACFLCPLPAGPSSWVWGGRPFGELDGGETRGRRPLPHAPEGQSGRAERDFVQVWGLPPAPPHPQPAAARLWPRR